MGPPPSRRTSYGAEVLRRKSRVVSETMGGYGGLSVKTIRGTRRGREGGGVGHCAFVER